MPLGGVLQDNPGVRELDELSISLRALCNEIQDGQSFGIALLPRLSRYVLDGRYNIDNNGIENAIRPSLSEERITSSAATTMLRSEQPSYTHSSARRTMSMCVRGWRIHLEESLQKRTLASYYLATGRYYPLIAGNNQPLPTTSCHYWVLPQ